MRRLALALLTLAGLGIFPSGAGAVTPGPNGPILFTSGRDDGGTALADTTAQIWILDHLGGTASRVTTETTLHHRHATWSPDRTKIAYAQGPSGYNGPWDIFVRDLTQPVSATNPINITNSSQSEDRPTWSRDGIRIAYEKEVAASTWDIKVRPATGGSETTIATSVSTGSGASWRYARADWTADSRSLVYAKLAGSDYDIYRSPADGSDTTGTPVWNTLDNDYQPAVSPDGKKICFTRDTGLAKNIWVLSLGPTDTPSALTNLSSYNFECAWSPDGQKIAFGRGAFGDGQIVARNADGTGSEMPVTNDAGNARFDGNVDWAPNPVAPPKPSFAGSKKTIRVNRKRRFNFTFHAAPGLKGKSAFKSVKKIRVSRKTKRKRRVTLARKSFTVPASGKVTLRIRLSKKKFRILKLDRKIRTRVTVTVQNAVGLKNNASKRVTLKAPEKRRG